MGLELMVALVRGLLMRLELSPEMRLVSGAEKQGFGVCVRAMETCQSGAHPALERSRPLFELDYRKIQQKYSHQFPTLGMRRVMQ